MHARQFRKDDIGQRGGSGGRVAKFAATDEKGLAFEYELAVLNAGRAGGDERGRG